MGKSKFFLLVSLIFFASNLLILNYLSLDWLGTYLVWAFLLLLFLVLAASKNRLFFLLLVVVIVGVRIYYFQQSESFVSRHFVYDNKYTFTAKVVDTDKRLNGWQLVVAPENLADFSGLIIVYSSLYPVYVVNDRLQVTCKIFKPQAIATGSDRTFAYDKYLAKDNILATCPSPQLIFLNHQSTSFDWLFTAKQYFLDNLDRYLPDPSSGFAKAIVLDARRELPDYLTPLFSHTGLTHVISISGLHMVVIIWFFHWLLQALGLKRQYIFWFLLIVLFTYLYLLGFISPALRSTAMIIMVLLGPMLGRPAISGYSLLFLADIFVLVNPYLLIYDLGFQLSFAATLGLILYVNWFKEHLKFLPNRFKIREVFSVTLAAQMFTWPLVIYYFQNFSLVAPLANFFVLPLFPPILFLTLGVAILGGIAPVGQSLAWPLYILISLMFKLIKFLGDLPMAYLQITAFSQTYFCLSLLFMFIITITIKPYERPHD